MPARGTARLGHDSADGISVAWVGYGKPAAWRREVAVPAVVPGL
jgi:hypothetical protein